MRVAAESGIAMSRRLVFGRTIEGKLGQEGRSFGIVVEEKVSLQKTALIFLVLTGAGMSDDVRARAMERSPAASRSESDAPSLVELFATDRSDRLQGTDALASTAGPRPRVLVIAEAANPEHVSVPLVGWSLARAIGRHADSHLVTQVRNRSALLRAGLIEGRDFTAIDSERIAAPAYRLAGRLPGGWTTRMAMTAVTYGYFERLVWDRFEGSLRAGRWDLVHRITPLSPTVPSPISRRLARLGVPFVIGPLNGGVPWPKEFSHARHAEREWLSYLRGAYRLLPGYRSTRRNAAAIICGSKATLSQMPKWCRDRCRYMPENAIDPERFDRRVVHSIGGPLRVAFVGRLVPYKCPDVVIDALSESIRQGRIELDIIGDGPLMGTLRAQVAELGITDGVRLDGWVPHERIQERLVESEVLAFPSIREFGGGVVLEAMALGLCPVVVDYGGPGELVDASRGRLVPIGTRDLVVEGMRREIERLVHNPAEARLLGSAAREFAMSRFTWDAKARWVVDLYASVLRRS